MEGKEKEGNEKKIGQNQFYDIIANRKPDWQSIIYELIHTEQLNPWDIDILRLTKKYFEKIHKIEEADFYISSKILLAAALLLRIKSEFLLNRDIKTIDEALFGKKQEKQETENIEIDEDKLPLLIPKTPLPRQKKVTLPELMGALNKAIKTENRRIKKEVNIKRAQKISKVNIPKFRRVNLKDRIKQFYSRVLTSIKKKPKNKVEFTEIAGKEREEKLASFLPVLHLSNNKKLWLEQEKHLKEIWVYLYEHFLKNKENFYEELEKDIEEIEEMEDIENPKNKKTSGLEKARQKQQEKKKLQKEIKRELKKELNTEIENINKEEEIEKATGFNTE